MEKEATTPRPVCAQEALALLNCATENPYDRDKCLALLDVLRECIAQKVIIGSSALRLVGRLLILADTAMISDPVLKVLHLNNSLERKDITHH